MWTSGKNFEGRGCVTPPTRRPAPRRSPLSERKTARRAVDFFHVIHKVPPGDSPYVKAKRAQLIDKDFGRAVGLFWAAINAGDRVDSALKDMAIVMKQLNRSDEAIEAIKSFRHLCPVDSQESLDNILIELYKRSGRIEEEVQMLQEKLRNIEDRKCCYSGSRFKTARSQGKKIQVTADEERWRIMGNLAWAHIQMNNFETAEKLYREALCLKQDRNKQCNLAICLMRLNKVSEARALLHAIGLSSCSIDGETDESYMKSYERALEMLNELEGERSEAPGHFTPTVARDSSISRTVSDRFGRGEETWVINEERGSMSSGGAKDGKDSGNFGLDSRERSASPFETPKRQFSAVCEATSARKAINSAPRVPVRRNIGFSSMGSTGLREGSRECSRNRAPFQPSHSIPSPNEHNRYSILGSPEPHYGVVGNYILKNDLRKAYEMNEEGKWVWIFGTEEEKSAGSKTKEDLLAHWSIGEKPKKSWADIAEEEEEEEEEDYFDDDNENVDANVITQHHPRSQMNDDLNRRVALFSLEESKNAASVRRSLKFDSNDPFHGEVKVREQKRPRPRKRLPVFRNITRLHHTA